MLQKFNDYFGSIVELAKSIIWAKIIQIKIIWVLLYLSRKNIQA